jgi:hypothetical protein
MQELPPLAVIDPDDAYEYVVANLDSIVAATLTHDDVRIILDAAIEYLVSVGIANNGDAPEISEPLVVDAVDYVILKTSIQQPLASDSFDEPVAAFLDEQVEAVLDLLTAYMSRIGAVGRAVGGDDLAPSV